MSMPKRNVHYSTWLIALYSLSALVLMPWIVYLSQSLPSREIAGNWDKAWVGFDLGILLLIVLTAILAYRRSARLAPVASSLATILIVDAWFDVMTARPGIQQVQALVFAMLIEVPMALITFTLVHQALAQIDWDNQHPMVVGKKGVHKAKD